MKPTLVLFLLFVLSVCSTATPFNKPDTLTYEWTVQQTRRVIPIVDSTDARIRDAISQIGNPMTSPIALKHELPDELLDLPVNWQLKDILWIDLVAKIADTVDAEIVIGKGVVTLRPKEVVEPEPEE